MTYGELIRSSRNDDIAAILIGDALFSAIRAVYDPGHVLSRSVCEQERMKLIQSVRAALGTEAAVPSEMEAMTDKA